MPPRKRKGKDQNRTKKVLMGIATFFIFFGFIFGGNMLGGSNAQTVQFEDYTFTYREGSSATGRWEFKMDKERYKVFYVPQELADIPYDPAMGDKLDSTIFYVAIEPPNATNDPLGEGMGLALYRFQQDFTGREALVVEALSMPPTNDSLPGLETWQVWNCENATNTVPVVLLKRGMNTNLTLQGNCIVIEASKPFEFLRAYDRLLLGVLGVMP